MTELYSVCEDDENVTTYGGYESVTTYGGYEMRVTNIYADQEKNIDILFTMTPNN